MNIPLGRMLHPSGNESTISGTVAATLRKIAWRAITWPRTGWQFHGVMIYEKATLGSTSEANCADRDLQSQLAPRGATVDF